MSEISTKGARVDVFSVEKSSEAGHFDDGTPVLETVRQQEAEFSIVPKDVNYITLVCDECEEDVELEYNELMEPECPECGLIAGQAEEEEAPEERIEGEPIPGRGGL